MRDMFNVPVDDIRNLPIVAPAGHAKSTFAVRPIRIAGGLFEYGMSGREQVPESHARFAAPSPANRRRGVEESASQRPYASPATGPLRRSLPATNSIEQVRA